MASWRTILAHRRLDVTAINRGNTRGGPLGERVVQKRAGDMLGGNLLAEQIAREVFVLADAARLTADARWQHADHSEALLSRAYPVWLPA